MLGRLGMNEDVRNRKHGRSTILGKEMFFWFKFKWVQRRFPLEMKGKVIPCWWTENGKCAGTNSGESGERNLETEIIRSGAESTGGCVKLKTVTEIRRSSARDTVIAERVYLVLNSLLDWSQWKYWNRGVMWAVLRVRVCVLLLLLLLFSVWGEQNSSVCDDGFGQRKQAGQRRQWQ